MKKTTMTFITGLVMATLGGIVSSSFVLMYVFLGFANNLTWDLYLEIDQVEKFYSISCHAFFIGIILVVVCILVNLYDFIKHRQAS